ncbi:hypothetical protein TYRP_013088 [Tyrophagus putrescentiae]|nr:hypothetical protein TYRP_013088 [Tyrophagus putrescentiae]
MNRNNQAGNQVPPPVFSCPTCFSLFMREDIFRLHIGQCTGSPAIELARQLAQRANSSSSSSSSSSSNSSSSNGSRVVVVVAEADSTVPDHQLKS